MKCTCYKNTKEDTKNFTKMKTVKFNDNKSLFVDMDIFGSFMTPSVSTYWPFTPAVPICSTCGEYMQSTQEIPDHCLRTLYNINPEQVLKQLIEKNKIESLLVVLDGNEILKIYKSLTDSNPRLTLKIYILEHSELFTDFETIPLNDFFDVLHMMNEDKLIQLYRSTGNNKELWNYLLTNHRDYLLENYEGEELTTYIFQNLPEVDLGTLYRYCCKYEKLTFKEVVCIWKRLFCTSESHTDEVLEFQDYVVTKVLSNLQALVSLTEEELEPLLSSEHFTNMLGEREVWLLLWYCYCERRSNKCEFVVNFCIGLLQQFIYLQKTCILWEDERMLKMLPWIQDRNDCLSYLLMKEIVESNDFNWIFADHYAHLLGACLDEALAEQFLNHPSSTTMLKHYCLQCTKNTDLYSRKRRKLI